MLLLTSCGYLQFVVGLVTSCGFLRKGFWSSCVWNFLRIKRNLTLFSPLACSCGARTSYATSCACIIFGLYCTGCSEDCVFKRYSLYWLQKEVYSSLNICWNSFPKLRSNKSESRGPIIIICFWPMKIYFRGKSGIVGVYLRGSHKRSMEYCWDVCWAV